MENYKILIYGCGDLGKKFFARLSDKYTIVGFIDEKAEMLKVTNSTYEIFSLKQAACVGSKNEYIVIVALHDGTQHDIVAAKLYKMGYDKIIYSPMKLTISYSLYVDALKYDTTFFTEAPSPCSWHEGECEFFLNEGTTRGMFLISNNYDYIPIIVTTEDFAVYKEWKRKKNFE